MTMARHGSQFSPQAGSMRARTPALTELTFLAWLAQAAPGDSQIYHLGFLAVDAETEFGGLSAQERRSLRMLADAAFRAAEQGLVHLVQARLGTDRFAYLAIARPKTTEPQLTPMVSLVAEF